MIHKQGFQKWENVFIEIWEEKRQKAIFVWWSGKTIFLEPHNKIANEGVL